MEKSHDKIFNETDSPLEVSLLIDRSTPKIPNSMKKLWIVSGEQEKWSEKL